MAKGRLALRLHILLEVVDVEDRLGRVPDPPDDHVRDLHRVATAVVDLELWPVQGAGPHRDLVAGVLLGHAGRLALFGACRRRCYGHCGLARARFTPRLDSRAVGVEGVGPAEPGLPHGAFVGAEEDAHACLVGLQSEKAGRQDGAQGEQYDAHHHHGYDRPVIAAPVVSEHRGHDQEHDAHDEDRDDGHEHPPAAGGLDLLLVIQ